MSRNKPRLYVTDTKIKDYEKSNYHKKVEDLLKNINAFDGAPGVHHIKVAHDSWCNIYKQKTCNCNPEISK